MNSIKIWLEIISGIAILVSGAIAALWAYTKFILERGLLPPAQFDIQCTAAVGVQDDKILLEVILSIKNLGTSTLVATNIRIDLLYLNAGETPSFFKQSDPEDPKFAKIQFPNSIKKQCLSIATGMTTRRSGKKLHGKETRGFRIIWQDTFVQPAVEQRYTCPTSVPKSATFILIWSSFEYAQHPSKLQEGIIRLSRRLGLIQWSLSHLTVPHTAERLFPVRLL